MSSNNKPSVSVGRSVGLCLCSIGKFSSKLLTEPFALAAAVLTSPDYTVLRGSIFVYGAYRLLKSEVSVCACVYICICLSVSIDVYVYSTRTNLLNLNIEREERRQMGIE